MRVRIRKDIDGMWIVESKKWYEFEWHCQKCTLGDTAEKRALEYARLLLNPMTIEITKEKL
jgi:hypothetical protein